MALPGTLKWIKPQTSSKNQEIEVTSLNRKDCIGMLIHAQNLKFL